MSIKDTAFYKYLLSLTETEREIHLRDCAISGGEMFYELAKELNEYHPEKLARMIENEINRSH